MQAAAVETTHASPHVATTPMPVSTVADILTLHPQARHVFDRYDIDYGCVGDKTVAEVCRDMGLELAPFLGQLSATGGHDASKPRWDTVPIPQLVRHIVDTCHRPLQEGLPLVLLRTRALLAAEGERMAGPLPRIVALLEALLSEMVPHMQEEETHLFPWIRQHSRHPDLPMPSLPRRLHALMDEHEYAIGLLRQLRVVTHDYSVPVGKSDKWVVVWQGLAELDATLHEHIHLENNVLFPRIPREGA